MLIGNIASAEDLIQKFDNLTMTNDSRIKQYKQQFNDLKMLTEKANACYRKDQFQTARKLKNGINYGKLPKIPSKRKLIILFVVECCQMALDIAHASTALKLLKGECLTLLGRFKVFDYLSIFRLIFVEKKI